MDYRKKNLTHKNLTIDQLQSKLTDKAFNNMIEFQTKFKKDVCKMQRLYNLETTKSCTISIQGITVCLNKVIENYVKNLYKRHRKVPYKITVTEEQMKERLMQAVLEDKDIKTLQRSDLIKS